MNALSADRDAILRAVLDEPGDDLHRLAFADWCEEDGDPVRAGFVRASLRLAKAPVACWRIVPQRWLKDGGILDVPGRQVPHQLSVGDHVLPQESRPSKRWAYPVLSVLAGGVGGRTVIVCGHRTHPLTAYQSFADREAVGPFLYKASVTGEPEWAAPSSLWPGCSHGKADWSRGFVGSVRMVRSELPHLPGLVRRHPVGRVDLLDRRAQQWLSANVANLPAGADGRWFWCVDAFIGDLADPPAHWVPDVVKWSPVWTRAKWYCNTPTWPTEGEADAAMSEALLLWARGG
jgi:uncharacterized protein (TIGR02996 family)